MRIEVTRLRQRADCKWAAQLMASSEPWLTLGRDFAYALRQLRNPAKECHLIQFGGARAGFLILDLNGPLGGYIQTIGVVPEMRGRGIGTAVLCWAEAHIFKKHRNVLLCVSSFNRRARQLYRRLGYETVDPLRAYVVAGHDEILLRKTLGPLSHLAGPAPAGPRPVRRPVLRKRLLAKRDLSLNK